MLETDFILMMTAGVLFAPEKMKEKAVTDFEGLYSLQDIKSPGRVSLGGVAPSGLPLAWLPWTEAVRAKGVRGVSVLHVPYYREGLAPHIAAAFAGVVSFVLQAETAEGRFTWYLKAENSRRTEITAGQFAQFIEIQSGRSVLWERIHQLINESNGLNNRPLVPVTKTVSFLQSPAGADLFEFLGDNLLSEIQIECAVKGITLSFPPEWDSYFDPPYGPSDFLFPERKKESVYFYSLRAVTAGELRQIIAAQPFAEKILPALNKILRSEPPPALAGVSGVAGVADAAGLLNNARPDQLQAFSALVCQVIIDFCQENDILPVLPDSLMDAFGPDETDQRRARARGHTDLFRRFKPMSSSWRYYQFELLSASDFDAPAGSEEQTASAFLESLNAIQQFAEKQKLGWFAGNFRLASFVLSPAVMNGPFSAEAINALERQNDFGDEYNKILANSLFYVAKIFDLGWPKQKCFGLLAFSLTNVFGGMGSWNDQYFETDQETYDKVSADFFAAREPFFAAMLSNSNPLHKV